MLGLGWMLDAFEVNIVGSVLGVLQRLWHVTAGQASLIVSVWLLGIMVGALFFGYLADRFGRRRLFILTLLVYSGFTVVSALSPGYYAFLAFRFLTAIGVGAEYSAVNAAITELIPARYRGRAAATVMNFWPLGSILAGIVTLYFVNALPPSIGWRFAFALGAIIALFSVWARKTLPESPRWLAGRGELGTAESVAHAIANGDNAFDHRRLTALRPQEPRRQKFFAELADLVHRDGHLGGGERVPPDALEEGRGSGHGTFIERPWVMMSASEIERWKNAAAINPVAIRFPLCEPTRMEILADFFALDDTDRGRQQSV